jgi:hypothetical protein
MEAVPAAAPVISPVVALARAVAVLLLLHVPPAVASLRVIDKPEQTADGPVMVEGKALTVTTEVVAQPVAVIV